MVADAFDGIDEKLIRSNENIRNLDAEISRFFEECKYPVLPDEEDKLFLEAIEYYKQLEIPLRFSVLADEVIHHLRSSLDHLIWHFSTPDSRAKNFHKIEFPVFDRKPVDEKQLGRYKGKIQGITDPRVRELIESLQPYNSPDYVDCPLSIIHHMDIFYKHRELVLQSSTGSLRYRGHVEHVIKAYQNTHPDTDPAEVALKFKSYGKVLPQVSFKDFGRRKIEPVVQALNTLRNFVVNDVDMFRGI